MGLAVSKQIKKESSVKKNDDQQNAEKKERSIYREYADNLNKITDKDIRRARLENSLR